MRQPLRQGLWIVALAIALHPLEARGGSGPGKNIWPARGQLDVSLYEKAMRIQSRMWWHLSPEGLLVETHRRGATREQLSHDAAKLGDAAIWTGCYAAAQACRWHVTRDPDAMAQLRVLAKGLRNLSDVTGVRGRIVRSLGRPIAGERRHPEAIPSRAMRGVIFRPDVSRDQLAGITIGWYFIWKYADTAPDLKALASESMAHIARRLAMDDFWLRDWKGGKTKHGELTAKVPLLPVGKNGSWASIGLAAVLAAAEMNYPAPDLLNLANRLDRENWDEAISSQNTFFASLITNSNVNMTALSLLVIAKGKHPNAVHRARMGMGALRNATRGWWNAGICACWLLGGLGQDRTAILGEIRATLHAMPEDEIPIHPVQRWEDGKIVPIQLRTRVSGWAWKEDPRRAYVPLEGAKEHPRLTHTRADWLFGYWLARAAGALRPKAGPGADPTAHHCPMHYPPWMP